MDECQPILVDRTQLPYGWDVWTLNDHASPGVSEGGRGTATVFVPDEHAHSDEDDDHEHGPGHDHTHAQTQQVHDSSHFNHYSSAEVPDEEQAPEDDEEADETEGPVADEVEDETQPPVDTTEPENSEAEEPENGAETSEEHGHGQTEEDVDHETDDHGHSYAISDAKLKKVKDYCEQLCDFGFDPDELCMEFHFTCDNNN